MLNKFNALFITFLLLTGCFVTQKTFSEQDVNLKKLSVEKFGASFHILYNNKRSFALVLKQEKSSVQNPKPVLQFFIYEMKKDKIIFEESVPAGKIKWKTNNQIEVIVTPETISTEDNNKLYGYIYDVDLRTKTELNSQSIKQNQ